MNSSEERFEEDRQRKQNYLKTHILNDPNYDPDEFVNYMEAAKPGLDGKEIDNWEYDELVDRVQQFKAEKDNFESNTTFPQYAIFI
jgi:hypothetical protein